MNEDLHKIGLALKSYRKSKGLTQLQVAEKAGIYRQNISDIERGVFVGAISTLQAYLQVAGLALSYKENASEFPQLEDLKSLFEDDDANVLTINIDE